MNHVKDYKQDIHFENRLPNRVNSTLSIKNRIKQAAVSFGIFITVLLFGALIGIKYNSKLQDTGISTLEVTIISWSLLLYGLLNTFLYFRTPIKFEITWLRFTIHVLSSIIFSATIILLKLNIFGDIFNSKSNPETAATAIKLYAIINSSFSAVILIYLLVIAILQRRQYALQLKTTILGGVSLAILIAAPFMIQKFSSSFKIINEYIFMTSILISIGAFILVMSLFGIVKSFESAKLKNVNKFLGTSVTITGIASILGVAIYSIANVGIELKLLTATSLILSLSSFAIVNLYLVIFKKFKNSNISKFKSSAIKQNSLENKLIIKGYIIFNLIFAIVLIFLVSKTEIHKTYEYSVMIATFPIILIGVTLLILQLNNIIVFVRWEIISIVANFLLAFLFILMQGLMFTIPDKEITQNWLGRGIWFLILSVYLVTELVTLSIETASLFIGNSSKGSFKDKIKNTVKNKGKR